MDYHGDDKKLEGGKKDVLMEPKTENEAMDADVEETTDFHELREIGLSQAEINCYASLERLGLTTAKQVANDLGLSVTNLYRILARLEKLGFVGSLKTPEMPTYFSARKLDAAMEQYVRYQLRVVQPLTAGPLLYRPSYRLPRV